MAEPRITVAEASATYESAMHNVAPVAPGICRVCHAFISTSFPTCFKCGRENPNHLDVVVPITYSEHGYQMHHALWQYKNAEVERVRRYAAVRLVAILWRFIAAHERCSNRREARNANDLEARNANDLDRRMGDLYRRVEVPAIECFIGGSEPFDVLLRHCRAVSREK